MKEPEVIKAREVPIETRKVYMALYSYGGHSWEPHFGLWDSPQQARTSIEHLSFDQCKIIEIELPYFDQLENE